MTALRAVGVLALLTAVAAPALAQDAADALKVCADPNNLPFSNRAEQGFENKLARIWARELGVGVEYTWFPQRRGFERNTLNAEDPERGGYKCDVIVGVPTRLGRGGAEAIVEYDLTAEEGAALQASAAAVRELCGVVDRLLPK